MPGRDSATSQTSNDNNAANIQGKHYGASTGSKNSLQISSGDQYNTGPIYNGAYNQNNGIQNSAESGGSISIDQQTLNQDPETGVNPAGPSGQGPFENAGAERPPAAAPFHDQYQTFASHPPYGYPGPHFGYLYSHDQLIPHPNSYPPPPYLHGYGACFCPNPHGPSTYGNQLTQLHPSYPHQPQPQPPQEPPKARPHDHHPVLDDPMSPGATPCRCRCGCGCKCRSTSCVCACKTCRRGGVDSGSVKVKGKRLSRQKGERQKATNG